MNGNAPDIVGTTLSHYSVEEKLGEGAMGVVYRARDLILNRPVALKLLTEDAAGTHEGSERVLREARAASALNHPNVITVYEVGEERGSTFIVTEFIEGTTLRSLMRAGGAPAATVEDLARQVAEGLRAAHACGIVHRDIKPDNLMLTRDGRVKIMDFGIARTRLEGSPGGDTGITGTLRYMSPEQIEGRPVDQRSDIFSLGAVLYELLAGAPAFDGEYEDAVHYAVVNADPPALTGLRPDASPALSALVTRCLRKRPDERYQSCDEILADIGRAKPGARSLAGPVLARLRQEQTLDAGRGPLTGRDAEISRFREHLEESAAGKGRTVLVTGESGIGKTKLLLEVLHEARERGFLPLMGRCLFQERDLPYHPLAESFRHLFASDGGRLLDDLARDAGAAGTDISGRLSSIRAFLRLSAEPVSLQGKEQLWDAVYTLLRALAEVLPVALVIDDLQWADRETVALFAFLARNAARDAVLLVGAYRHEPLPGEKALETDHLRDVVRQLRLDGTAGEIELARLPESASAVLMRRLLAAGEIDPALERKVFTATEGNPLFISELVSLMRASGSLDRAGGRWRLVAGGEFAIPDRVRDVITQRLRGLAAADRELLEAASCDGDLFDSATVAACLQAERLPVLRRLQGIEQGHALIHFDAGKYRFDHPLIRQVLYAGMLPELRGEYHRLIAGRLIAGSGGEASSASRIAHHLIESSQEARSLEYLVLAGDHARDLCAFDEAAAHYERADEILTSHPGTTAAIRLGLIEGLGDVAMARGKTRDALGRYGEAEKLARDQGFGAREIEGVRKSAACLRILGETEQALVLAERAVGNARRRKDRREEAECLHAAASVHTARGEYDRTIHLCREALGIAQEVAAPRLAAANLAEMGLAAMHTGEYRVALQWLGEARSLQDYEGDRRGLAGTLNALALVTHRLARYEEALAHAGASLDIKQSIGDATAIPGGLNVMGDIHRDSGNLPAALEYHSRSLALAREHANRGSQCDNLRDLGSDYLLMGDLAAARRHLDEVLRMAGAGRYPWHETRATITLAELQLVAGDTDAADPTSVRGLDLARSLKATELIIEALWKRGLILARLGRREEARELLADAAARCSASGHRIFLWQIEADNAGVLESEGNVEEARAALAAAARHRREIVEGFLEGGARDRFLAWAQSARPGVTG
ncbi:MAG TPA: protein kinase [Bacteroidota bacterium]|nr:protein kinase [Bacteroidota bacterium]